MGVESLVETGELVGKIELGGFRKGIGSLSMRYIIMIQLGVLCQYE